MEIVYAAYTEAMTLMLDGRGVCRWALPAPGKSGVSVPDRLVGAQFVACIDRSSEQGLASMPMVGLPMLFASTDASGHISLVRTSPLLRFEDKREAVESARLEVADTPANGSPLPLVRRWSGAARRRTPPPPVKVASRRGEVAPRSKGAAGLKDEAASDAGFDLLGPEPDTVRRPRVR